MVEVAHETITLTKERVAEQIQHKIGVSARESKELVEVMIEEIKSRLEKGESVKLSGFGKWEVRKKNARPGRNPHTGERMEITARQVVTFHPSERLRLFVNHSEMLQQEVG